MEASLVLVDMIVSTSHEKLYGRELVRPTSELILPVFFLLECIMYEPKILTIHSL